MKIYIGSDHAGYDMKEELKPFLISLGYEVEDKGAFSYDKNDDYPDFIKPVAEIVAKEKGSIGIILGGSGQGEAMCANKIQGIRAVVYYGGRGVKKDIFGNKFSMIAFSREHNDANILSLGARFLDLRKAKKAVKLFLESPFTEEERHVRRIKKLESNNIPTNR